MNSKQKHKLWNATKLNYGYYSIINICIDDRIFQTLDEFGLEMISNDEDN